MAGPFSDDKERVKQAIDIVDLVGSYLSLRRQGRNFVGLCPWHDDSKPSLNVNQDRQTFKCWVCNLGGDIFSFIMQKEGVEFREALEMLAERAGISLEHLRRLPQARHEGDDREPDKKDLFKAMAWAVERFHDALLQLPEATPARDYLSERGITAQSIEQYSLGFAPDHWDWLVSKTQGKSSALRALERAGVLGKSERGYYDRFKGRVLFPIRDAQGRPIALGGRVLPALVAAQKSERPPAKYINSPETPLFSKNREFYGLDLAREAIAQTGHVLVMEGYTDCIVARQFGFRNVVAVLGTALGENHVRRLRFADHCRVILVLDGDEAGRKRANEVLELFVAAQVDLRILTLPDDLDPCDFLQQRGAEAFAALVEQSVDALEHKIQLVTADLNPNDTHAAHLALEDILSTLAAAPIGSLRAPSEAHVRQQQLLTRLARRFRLSEEELRGRLSALRRRPQRAPRASDVPSVQAKLEPLAPWERELLELVLLVPDAMPRVMDAVRVERMSSLAARQVYVACCELWRRGIPPALDRLLNEFEQPAIHNLLVELDEHGHARGVADATTRLDRLLETLRIREEQRRHREQVAALEEKRLDEREEMKSVLQMIEQKRNRQGISKPTDG